jgi:glucokinase
MKPTVLTLDAGGTTFEFSAIRGGRPAIDPVRMAAPARELDECLAAIRNGFVEARDRAGGCDAVSFAFPGPADYPRGVIGDLANLPCFRGGVALGPMLEDDLGVPVYVNNDGDLFALGESLGGFLPWANTQLARAGSRRRFRNLLGVTLGTGLGGGAVIDGRMLVGDNAAGAELWLISNRLDRDLPAEEGASIRAVRAAYARHARLPLEAAPDPEHIAAIADGKAPGSRVAARAAYRRLGEVAGDAIANALAVIDGLVVIGGGLAGAARHFMPALIAVLGARYDSGAPRIPSDAFALDDSSALMRFVCDDSRAVTVPGGARSVPYQASKRIGVGVSRLGTAHAIALGAYAFALDALGGAP